MKMLVLVTIASVLSFVVGCDSAPASTASTAAASATTKPATSATSKAVDVTVDDKGFHPDRVEAKKGEKLQLRFKRTHDGTCATHVSFPDIDVKKELPLGEVVTIDVPTDEARTLSFQCGMGMYKSSVLIN